MSDTRTIRLQRSPGEGVGWRGGGIIDPVAVGRSTLALRASTIGLVAALVAAGCGASDTEESSAIPPVAEPPRTDLTTTSETSTTTLSATSTTSTTTSTTSTTSSTSTTTSTTVPTTTTTTTLEPLPKPDLPATNAAFDLLARRNAAVSMTVLRDGVQVFARASGNTIDGAEATSDSPMVIASVSKLITGLAVARLHEQGLLDVDAQVPWDILGIVPASAWNSVTTRELLEHTSGMPVVRTSWFDGSGDCTSYLPRLVEQPPAAYRGRWTYSNGNYCALGLLVERITGQPLDQAVQNLVFDELEATGLHLTINGEFPTDVGHAPGVGRLSRLGGAGTFIVSTDDLAAAINATTPADREVMSWPGMITDQYGWGHTGTVSGAKSCAWVLEFGRTTIAATIAGNSPDTGGALCDIIVQAIAADLDISGGLPARTPP
jgi:D-alanyl-D-alanine carboxypeptidase